jgi:23S rRNA (cytidine1920-2'-O)/16S rRNA (cytidine1409-2'-O)-methyltransferase
MKNKIRLDQILVDRELFESRHKAQAAIIAGLVSVDGKIIDKPGKPIDPTLTIDIKKPETAFASRGGEKLSQALKDFNVVAKGKICLDIGASTGGFTDCLLQNGAIKVYAVDVGYGQLAWKLQQDPRVFIFDRTNARYLTEKDLYKRENDAKADLAVMDVSFISILKILPAVYNLLKDGGEVVSLIKPQFEAGRDKVEKGGLVKDPQVHQEVIKTISDSVGSLGFQSLGITASPITGKCGNVEYFIYLRKK